jgi:tryptophanyl-tRNA synthetase
MWKVWQRNGIFMYMNSNSKKTLISGVKPTGTPHLGNYFGAMKQFVDLQNSDKYNVFVFIADLHALTSVKDANELRENTFNLILDYLAIGLDPEKITLFRQSDVPPHAELCWVFNCITTMPELMRAHSFKDAEAKNKDINVGIFDYPVLMAADILMYDVNVVPVGRDQAQHLEITRDTARTFNNLYCKDGEQIFVEPEAIIIPDVAVVPGTDGQKMSKSYKNVVPLFATDEEWQKAVMSIVTDSKMPDEVKNPDECNIFALHKLVTPTEQLAEIRSRYENGAIGYKESKDLLLESIKNYFGPMRERRNEFAKNPEAVMQILQKGGAVALEIATKKMNEVKQKVGLV